MRRVTICPVTRVEGRAQVELFLDERGEVSEAYFVVPELRGFERLCIGRPVEEMPGLTSRICGLCPEAHHMASLRALDELFGASPPPSARMIRELLYMAFLLANHSVHFFALAGPDLLLEPSTPRAQRTLFGVLRHLGPELARAVVASRTQNHEVIQMLGGRRIQLVGGVPGGWLRPVTEMIRERIAEVAAGNVRFAQRCLELFRTEILERADLAALLRDPTFSQPTHSMGMVDEAGRVSFCRGDLRVVGPEGREQVRFAPPAYREVIDEHVEPWTRVKLPYLKATGWHGLKSGGDSGVYAVGPLARLNAATGIATPMAHQAYEELYATFSQPAPSGGFQPLHNRLLTHAARLVEMLYAAERMVELAAAPELTDPEIRTAVPARPVRDSAVGCVEAPRGTLIHDYRVDSDGLVTGVNLIVATTMNNAAIGLSTADAARAFVHGGVADELVLNRIEMAIRAHDPCLACASHALPGGMPLQVRLRDRRGRILSVLRR